MCGRWRPPYAEFGVYNTEYRTVGRPDQQAVLLELSTSPNVIWVEFDDLKLGDDSQPLGINPYDSTLVGDVTARLQRSGSRSRAVSMR